MSVSIRKDAPPFVRFEFMECGVDAVASEKAGRSIPMVKAYALIMQHGSKDVHEANADEWLASIERKAIEGMYNPDWVARFKLQYEQFLKGNELPREGTPVRTWPAPNREQVIRLLALGIQTVEDLAAVPDNGLQNIGLDGRVLRDLARNYIEAGQGVGVLAKKVTDQAQTILDQTEQIKRMSESIAALEAQMPRGKKAA